MFFTTRCNGILIGGMEGGRRQSWDIGGEDHLSIVIITNGKDSMAGGQAGGVGEHIWKNYRLLA